MNIAVCVKQVPDTETRIQLIDHKINEDDINFILNPYDEFAVEEALQLAEKNDGEVTIISLGPDRVVAGIRNALAMGATKAIHIKTDQMPDDPLYVAENLAAVLKEGNYDLILLGKQAIDDDHSQMASLLANKMGLSAVAVVVKLEIESGNIKAEREIDGAHEIVECAMPAIISTQRGLNEPRYASLKGIMKAKKVKIEAKEPIAAVCNLEVQSFHYPPEKEAGKIVGESADAVPELLRLLHEEAKVI
jgi:electron transfer flavoprotein beta subunit